MPAPTDADQLEPVDAGWHNGAVPSRYTPSDELPERVQDLLGMLSSNSRVEALLFFAKHRTSTRQEFAAGASIPLGTTSFLLDELQKHGYITVDAGADDERGRRGSPLLYTFDRGRLYDDIAALLAHIAHLAD